VQALGALKENLAPDAICKAIKDPDQIVSDAAIDAAGFARCEQAVPLLIDKLAARSDPSRPWPPIVSALTRVGTPAIPHLEKSARSASRAVRIGSIQALAAMRDPGATSILLTAANDSDELIRSEAVKGLSALPDVGAARSTARAERDVPATATSPAPDDPRMRIMMTALHDPKVETRREAAAYFDRYPVPAALDDLLFALKDKDNGVVSHVVAALAKIGDPKAIMPMFELAAGRDTLDRNWTTIAINLQKMGKPAARILLPYLTHRERNVRFFVARVISPVDDPEFRRALDEAIAQGDQDVAIGAYEYFLRNPTDNNIPVLIKALDRRFNEEFILAMAQHKDPRLKDPTDAWMDKHGYYINTYINGQPLFGTR
jgi:HEAT repeat protein